MPKRKSKKPPLVATTTLLTQEIVDALHEEAETRQWGKSKLIRSILESWLAYWRADRKRKSSSVEVGK